MIPLTPITPFLFDQNLLLALNFDGGWFLDQCMYIVSGKLTWVPFYLLILWLIYARLGWKVLLMSIVTIALLITCTDQTATLAKTFLPKLRPTHYEPIAAQVHTVNGYVGGWYGTISSHAANCFGLALFTSLLLRRRWFARMMFVWAALVAYSRIYLGVHYPMDILIGTLEGLFWAWVWYRIYRWAARKMNLFGATPPQQAHPAPDNSHAQ